MESLEALLKPPFFDQWVAIITAGGVVLAPAAWAIKRVLTGHKVKKNVAEGICAELDDTVDTLGEASCHPRFKMTIIDPESTSAVKTCKKIRGTLTFLNHDAYDGFLHAGHLVTLDPELVQEIQNVYQRIKHHNKWLEHLMPLLDKESETGKSNLAVTGTYYNALSKYESELLEMIPALKKRLKALTLFRLRFGRRPHRVRAANFSRC